jgi:Stability determinant
MTWSKRNRSVTKEKVNTSVLEAREPIERREGPALDEWLRRKVEASLVDPRASIPAEKVFTRLRAYHAKQVKAAKRRA